MAKLNVKRSPIRTHEGGKAKHINAELQLRRSVMACMLWENTFYEDGEDIASRIVNIVPQVDPAKCAMIAIEARENMNLRHVPLLIVRAMAALATHRKEVKETLARVIQRPDELTEFLAIYWKDGRKPLSAQVKKGLAMAFTKFGGYNLAKYNRDGAIKLRDVLFLCHAKPKDEKQAEQFKMLIDDTLPVPDTWETNLSAGKDKKATWTRLMSENKLGGMALLRNLRNMMKAGVSVPLIRSALANINASRILPFRFIAAADHAPELESSIEAGFMKCVADKRKLKGTTVLLVDVSGSMDYDKISGKSEMLRIDAACGLAMVLREMCDDIRIATFSEMFFPVPDRRGFALRDAIVRSQPHGGTYLGSAVKEVERRLPEYDRLIVITDEQSHDPVPNPRGLGYMINVAPYKNGVGYGPWIHIDGFSESIVNYILEYES